MSPRTTRARRPHDRRRLFFESLERRELLATLTWRNPVDAMDIDGDGTRTPTDALIVIGDLITAGSRDLALVPPSQPFAVDASGDGFLSPVDALLVINVLINEQTGLLEETAATAADYPIIVTLGQSAGTRTYTLELTPSFDPSTSNVDDQINVFLLDPDDPALTLLDGGIPGTPIFSLTGSFAQTVPGLSSWDGSVLTLDLSRAAGDTGVLLVQIVASDAAIGTTVEIQPLSNTVNLLGTSAPVVPRLAVPPGRAVDLTGKHTLPDLFPIINDVRYNGSTGLYEANLTVQNTGAPVEADAVVAFSGLPAGVTLVNASGTTGDGRPYVNLSPGRPGPVFGTTHQAGPIRLQFSDPAALRVPLSMEALGRFTGTLAIDPIPVLNVSPGRHLEVPLIATGGFPGLPLTFTVDVLNLPGGLPTGKIEGQGRLSFEPTNAEIGTYTFDVLVSNGRETARRQITLNVVPDVETSTRLTGVVRDIHNVPLAGVPVSVGEASAVTAGDGSFVLDDPALDEATWNDAIFVQASALGPQYVDLTLPIFGLMHYEDGAVPSLQVGEHNELARDIFVPVLDLAAGVTVVPGLDTVVTNPALPGVVCFLPAGSVVNLDDTPYTGTFYLTQIPIDRAELFPDPYRATSTIIRIDTDQPVKFAGLGTLTLPNRDGFVPGEDDLQIGPPRGFGALLPATAGPLPPDEGGEVQGPINSPGEKSPQRNKYANPDKKHDPKDEKDQLAKCPPDTETVACASQIDLHSGNFQETHNLPTYQSQGQVRGITLAYNSQWADPRPIVHQSYSGQPGPEAFAFDPTQVRLMATLHAEIVNPTGGVFVVQAPGATGGSANLQGGENAWRFAAGDFGIALQLDLRGLPTGVYNRDGNIGVRAMGAEGWFGNTAHPKLGTELIHVNEVNSPFGAGWGLAGLQKIVAMPDGDLLLVDGGGEEILFNFNAGANLIESPQGDFSKLETIAGGYRRSWPDQSEDLFDAAGRLVSSTDRNGNLTQYEYNGDGRMVRITDPVGLETNLFYFPNGRLTHIVDPAGRTTGFEYDQFGNLKRIVNPDASERRFSYDAHHRMVHHVDERQMLADVLYGPGGRATGEVIPAYAGAGEIDTISVNNLQERNLAPFATGSTRNLPASPMAGTDLSNFVTWTSQGLQQTRLLDEYAKLAAASSVNPVTALDAIGELPRATSYNHHQLTRSVSGSSTTWNYGQHGNLLVEQDAEDLPAGEVRSIQAAGGVVTLDGVTALNNLPLTLEAWVNVSFRGDIFPGIEENLITTNPDPFEFFGEEPYGYGMGLDIVQAVDGTPSSMLSIATPGGGSRKIFSFTPFAPNAVRGPLLLTDEWRHIAVVYTPGEANTYLDGQLIDTYTFTQGVDPVGNQLILGKGFNSFIDAFIDDVRIWNVARTEAEIQRDLAQALVGTEPGLVHYFPFNQPGAVPNLTDHGPGGATATITGAVTGSVQTALAGTRLTYDSVYQQLTSITDGNGHRTHFDIDPLTGNTQSMRQVVGDFGGADDLVSTFTYLASGLVDTMTDPLGRVADYDYDARERLIKLTLAKGTPDEGVWGFQYDAAGNLTAEIDPNDHRTEYVYDVMGRLVKVTQPDPDAAGPLPEPVSQMYYNLAGDLTRSIDPLQRTTRLAYDLRGAVQSSTDSDLETTVYERNAAGNVTSMTNPLGHETQYVYDARQRLTQSIDPDGGVTKFEYDTLNNNLIAITDPNNNKTRYFYDSRNRVIERRDPLGGSEFYAYDFADNLTQYTDRLGRVTTYAFDDLNRLQTETWVGGGNAFNFAYDKAGNLLSATDANSGLVMTYDARDRLKTADNSPTFALPDVVLSYSYDPAGNRLAALATGAAILANAYVYDGLDRMTSVVQAGAAVSGKRVELTYNSVGQIASLDRFYDAFVPQHVATSTYTYDNRHRLTSLVHRNAADLALNFETLTYDAADRITRIVNGDGTTTYSYDDRSQLTGANHSDPANPDETYAYDANGNRTASSRHGSGYVSGPNNRLLSDGTFNYTYDAEGNMTRRTEIATGKVRDFLWDFRNRLVTISDKLSVGGTETQRVDFVYDPFDRRISKTVTIGGAAEATHFVYDGADVLFDFVDPDGFAGPALPAVAQTYLHGPAVDQILAQDDGTEIDWLLADHLGTITDLVDNAGAVVNHLKYDSYGNPISQTNPAESTRYSFTGREFDAETGLLYYRARYYDPAIGRFLSEDPIGLSGGTNMDIYVNNNPLSSRDPSGLQSQTCTAKKTKTQEEEEKRAREEERKSREEYWKLKQEWEKTHPKKVDRPWYESDSIRDRMSKDDYWKWYHEYKREHGSLNDTSQVEENHKILEDHKRNPLVDAEAVADQIDPFRKHRGGGLL